MDVRMPGMGRVTFAGALGATAAALPHAAWPWQPVDLKVAAFLAAFADAKAMVDHSSTAVTELAADRSPARLVVAVVAMLILSGGQHQAGSRVARLSESGPPTRDPRSGIGGPCPPRVP